MTRIDREMQTAFDELLLMERFSRLSVASMLRILQTIPAPVLAAALTAASAGRGCGPSPSPLPARHRSATWPGRPIS